MAKQLLLFVFFIILSGKEYAQDNEHLTKDLKCFERSGYTALDLLMSSREAGNYEVMAEWSEKVSSSEIVTKKYPLEGAFQYVIVLTTESDVDGTAIEIRNGRGEKLEYEYKVTDLDRNQINFFYTPPNDDIYQISFRAVNSHRPSTCMYMAILKGDPDPDED